MVPSKSAGDEYAPTSPESRLVGWDDPGQGIGDIRAHQSARSRFAINMRSIKRGHFWASADTDR